MLKGKRRQVAVGIGGHKCATWTPVGGSYIAEGKLKVLPTSPEDAMAGWLRRVVMDAA
jgi:hypothetical protein